MEKRKSLRIEGRYLLVFVLQQSQFPLLIAPYTHVHDLPSSPSCTEPECRAEMVRKGLRWRSESVGWRGDGTVKNYL